MIHTHIHIFIYTLSFSLSFFLSFFWVHRTYILSLFLFAISLVAISFSWHWNSRRRIDKTMAIARVRRRFPMPLEFYARPGDGIYLHRIMPRNYFVYTTNVSLAISQARKNLLVTRPNASRGSLELFSSIYRRYLGNSWLLTSLCIMNNT